MKIKAMSKVIIRLLFAYCLMPATFCSAQSTLTNGLVSYWKLDEASGDAADAVGTYPLTNANGTPFSSNYGKINNGILFNGSNQYFYKGGVSTTLPISISLWAKFTGTGNNYLLGFYPTQYTRIFFGLTTSGGDISGEFAYPGFDAFPNTSGKNYNDGNWHHIVVTFSTSQITLYVDGGATVQSVSGTWGATSIGNFELGGWTNWTFSPPGLQVCGSADIDEVGLWSRVLTAFEVTTLYNSGKGLQYPFSTNNIIFFGMEF